MIFLHPWVSRILQVIERKLGSMNVCDWKKKKEKKKACPWSRCSLIGWRNQYSLRTNGTMTPMSGVLSLFISSCFLIFFIFFLGRRNLFAKENLSAQIRFQRKIQILLFIYDGRRLHQYLIVLGDRLTAARIGTKLFGKNAKIPV